MSYGEGNGKKEMKEEEEVEGGKVFDWWKYHKRKTANE